LWIRGSAQEEQAPCPGPLHVAQVASHGEHVPAVAFKKSGELGGQDVQFAGEALHAAQVESQGEHVPLTRARTGLHDVHCVALGPLQVPHEASHGMHCPLSTYVALEAQLVQKEGDPVQEAHVELQETQSPLTISFGGAHDVQFAGLGSMPSWAASHWAAAPRQAASAQPSATHKCNRIPERKFRGLN
jgi:hypothetical protein